MLVLLSLWPLYLHGANCPRSAFRKAGYKEKLDFGCHANGRKEIYSVIFLSVKLYWRETALKVASYGIRHTTVVASMAKPRLMPKEVMLCGW